MSENWSLSQLSYSLAFNEGDISSASVISFMLLVVSFCAALIFIFKTKFFDGEGVDK
jgi:ABC-type sugar transport system permease subunit